ncbi:unnamed protein product [Protopolystoma xenopodis]|uniref:Small ribosomal subunit protein eS17 n=1 Tax=Protopolystoma xenopodis TaxID=117903 RepID=A0A3S5BR04_9PLAT|nr:unnamed protein product [Protopolystoma xenopodis]
MAHVRTKTVKKASRTIIERFYSKMTRDFHTNKKVCQDVAVIGSKRLRNKIAGYVTHLMKRIESGPVRGISIKLQEEERERRDNYQPEESTLDQISLEFDSFIIGMLNSMVRLYFVSLFIFQNLPHSKDMKSLPPLQKIRLTAFLIYYAKCRIYLTGSVLSDSQLSTALTSSLLITRSVLGGWWLAFCCVLLLSLGFLVLTVINRTLKLSYR